MSYLRRIWKKFLARANRPMTDADLKWVFASCGNGALERYERRQLEQRVASLERRLSAYDADNPTEA